MLVKEKKHEKIIKRGKKDVMDREEELGRGNAECQVINL